MVFSTRNILIVFIQMARMETLLNLSIALRNTTYGRGSMEGKKGERQEKAERQEKN